MEGRLIEQLEAALRECAAARDELERQQEVVDALRNGALELQPALELLASLKKAVLDKTHRKNEILLQLDIEQSADRCNAES